MWRILILKLHNNVYYLPRGSIRIFMCTGTQLMFGEWFYIYIFCTKPHDQKSPRDETL